MDNWKKRISHVQLWYRDGPGPAKMVLIPREEAESQNRTGEWCIVDLADERDWRQADLANKIAQDKKIAMEEAEKYRK